MDLLALVKLVVRRWYVVLPVVAISIGVAAFTQLQVEREYRAQGTLLLASPELDPSRSPRVPTELDAAVQRFRTSEGVAELVAAGASEDFTLTRLDALQVQVVVPATGAAAERTASVALEAIAESVLERQLEADIPEGERVTWSTNIAAQALGAEAQLGDATVDDPAVEESNASPAVTVGLVSLQDPAAGRTNPFVAGDTTSRLLQYGIQSDAGRLAVFDRVANSAFLGFEMTPQGSPGLIQVVTTARAPDVAVESFTAVQETLAMDLDARQDRADVPTSQRLTLEVVAAPGSPVDVTPPVDRGAAGIVALGSLLAVGLVIVVENISYRHRLRRQQRERLTRGPETPRSGGGSDLDERWSEEEPSLR
jgi:hypothetical protein